MKADQERELADRPLVRDTRDLRLTHHVGDGIACSGSRVPRWWWRLFLVTVVFAPLYLFFYHNGVEGRASADWFDRSIAANMRSQMDRLGDLSLDETSVQKYLHDPSWLQVGAGVYKTNCANCHGADGGGIVGPNLCDDSYKNINRLGDFLNVLQNGAGGGAMPPWKTKLSESEIVLVSSYVASLRGSQPNGGRPPEGRVIPPWPGPPAE